MARKGRFCTRQAPASLLASSCTPDLDDRGDGPSTSYAPRPVLAFKMPGRMHRRSPVLASLTSSQTALLDKISPAAASLRVGHTHLLPALFSNEQALLGHILEDYMRTENGFPRACLLCGDNQFMTPAAGAAGTEDGVIDFASRPWSCEQCARWVHLGCLGVQYVEDVPVKPYLHCHHCRQMFVGIESAAKRGEHACAAPHLASRGYSWSLATEMDHKRLIRDGQAGTLPGARRSAQQLERRKAEAVQPSGGSGRGGEDASGRRGRIPSGGGSGSDGDDSGSGMRSEDLAAPDDYASRLLSVYLVLSDAFSPAILDTLAAASTEYEGGKYAMLLRHRGRPVSAATFNVYGPELAQVCLMATEAESRQLGHGRAMLETLEQFLTSLGVQNLVLQPRSSTLDLWVAKFGFRVLHPTDVWRLYQQAPLPFFDCPVLCKALEATPLTA